jgi:hypothetical protein
MSNTIASSSTRFARFCDTNDDIPASNAKSPAMTTNAADGIPQGPNRPMMAEHELRCCCGRQSCAFLLHNNAALGSLERDISVAATMGKVRFLMPFVC